MREAAMPVWPNGPAGSAQGKGTVREAKPACACLYLVPFVHPASHVSVSLLVEVGTDPAPWCLPFLPQEA